MAKKKHSVMRSIKRGKIKGYFNATLNKFYFYRLSKRGILVGIDPYSSRDLRGQSLAPYQLEKLIEKNK